MANISKTVLPFVLLFGVLVVAAVWVDRTQHSVPRADTLESAIRETTRLRLWTPPLLSKYLSFDDRVESKLHSFAKMYGWPGRLDRGLGKDVLDSAVRLAHDQYGLDVSGVNINGPLDPRQFNIYFFRLDISPQFAAFRNQCVYVGFQNCILCDARFLYQFSEVQLAEHELDLYLSPGEDFRKIIDRPPRVRIRFLLVDLAATQEVFLWALAHEIGHIVHHHRPVSALMKILAPSDSQERSRAMEVQADQFALQVLQDNHGHRSPLLYQGMYDVATGLVAQAIGAQGTRLPLLPVRLEEFRGKIPVHRSSGNHPPMLIRVLDALVVMEEQFPPLDRPLAFPRVRSQVELIP